MTDDALADTTRSDLSMPALFGAQARRAPDAVALTFEDQQVTYGELHRRALCLGRRLRALGVGAGTLAGVCMERSVELIVALLGVLHAGGAYVPLDPGYPTERLSFMLRDVRAKVILCHSHLRSVVSWTDAVLLPVDAGFGAEGALVATRSPIVQLGIDAAASEEIDEIDWPITASEDLAHVIYTSGSTGRPKGVCISHRAVVARLLGGGGFVAMGPEDVGLLASSISFDAATLEIWGCLLNGARLVILPPRAPSLDELGRALIEQGVTLLWLSAGVFNAMVDEQLEALRGVRKIVVGGEALSVPHVLRAHKALRHGGQLINGYGPTENTIFTCTYPVTDLAAINGSVPIGTPLRGTQIHILDEGMNPVPDGATGELYTGGAGLAGGYWNRPELTAERFVRDPFAADPQARLYKTGDLVRKRPDGNLEYAGRTDHQVKIRGYRVELGEIEAALAEHPAVRASVVLSREVASGKMLVAYWVRRGQVAIDAAALQSHLAKKLPEHMVPAAFVELEALPLTRNGKVDRHALPAPRWDEHPSGERVVGPRNEVEEAITAIFAEVLRQPRRGVHDDFFAQGGDSLLATRVLSKVCRSLGIELPLSALFESPTPSALAARIQQTPRDGTPPLPPLEPMSADMEGELALSFAQERFYFLEKLDPANAFYNVAVRFVVRGPLCVRAMEQSLSEVVRRHDALRTTFVDRQPGPRQRIARPEGIRVPVIDLRGREALVEKVCLELFAQPFDLEHGPIFRFALLCLGPEEHVLFMAMHHIACDAWSLGVMLEEIEALYPAFREGRPPPSPEQKLRYADYALWQRGFVERVRKPQLAYWTQRLAGAAPYVDLPADRPRAATRRRGALLRFHISRERARALDALGRSAGATRFMTWLSAFAVLLSRHTGMADICIGTPVAGRRRPELWQLFGLFINTLILRTDLSDNPTFLELLGRVRLATLEAYDHQDVPFDEVVAALNPPRDPGRPPFVQIMFAMHDVPAARRTVGDVVLEAPDFLGLGAKLDFGIEMQDAGGEGMRGWVQYDADLFDASTVERMTRRFLTLLDGIVQDPRTRIQTLPLVPADERHRMLVQWNDTAAPQPADACIHTLFEAEVDRTPDAPALVADDRRMSYLELDRAANRLAHRLRALGVGPEARVAVAVDGAMDRVIAILGVLKAGGAFVPLDPAYPAARLAFILEDAAPHITIVGPALNDALPTGVPHRLCVDEHWRAVASESSERCGAAVLQSHLAYMIYTSGSTGRPKGVLVEHRALNNLARAQARAFDVRPESRVLQFAPFGFDAAVSEVFVTLTSGATLCFAPPNTVLAGEDLADVLRAQAIEIVTLPPSVLATLPEGRFPALRTLVSAGEACSAELVRRFAQNYRFINAYGPTETTVCATLHDCSENSERPGRPPIGRPLSNLQVVVLDAAGQPAPIGVPGELCVGGVGLARGYWKRPDLTRERFAQNPFPELCTERLYKTGDLVRWLPDGTLDFLGRIDHQVKVRGFRVEPGEIECALLEHHGVREAVVTARDEGAPGRRIRAYWIPRGEPAPDADALRAHLKERLPQYMIPDAFVRMQVLPRSPHGKVDRAALPSPSGLNKADPGEQTAPRTPVEELLAGIWADVLCIGHIGREDDFFAIGGHSLLASQVMARIRQTLGATLSLRALFESPTIAALAARVERIRGTAGANLPARIERVACGDDGPLSFAEQRLWFIDKLPARSAAYNISMQIRIRGPLDIRTLERSLVELVRRHEALRTVFPTVCGKPFRRIRELPPLSLRIADLRHLDEQARSLALRTIAAEEAAHRFDLEEGPLFRTNLIAVSADESMLFWTLHHIVCDGWSIGILLRELVAIYGAFQGSKPSPFAELPLQAGDFAAFQRRGLESEATDAQLDYWKKQLQGAPPYLDLPADRPRPPAAQHHGAVFGFRLPSALVESIDALGRRAGTTRFMTLLTGFFVLLSRHTGALDFCVGTPVAARDRPELSSIVGLFVNTLVLRADLSATPTALDLLSRVRRLALEAYEHKDVPFERLVDALNPRRDLGRSPLFQVMFALQDAPATLSAGHLTVELCGFESVASKFDLTLLLGNDGSGGLAGWIEYSTDLFDAATIARIAERYRVLLEGMAADPSRRISDLPLLAAPERHQLLVTWNDTAAKFPDDCGVHRLFEAQARRTPDSAALHSNDRTMTYRELDECTSALACRLRSLGVGPEVLVAVAAERSLERVIAVLSVLKAGGAYLPLDPSYPKQRLAFMLGDAAPRLLLAQKDVVEGLPSYSGTLVCLDDDGDLASCGTPLDTGVSGRNLAYVIYTSGSTGKPKGVLLEHRGLCNLAAVQRRAFGLGPGARVLQFAPFGFDAWAWEIVIALTSGATLCIPPKGLVLAGPALVELLRAHAIDIVTLPPAALATLQEEPLASLRTIVVAGEACPPDLVQHFASRCRLFNAYGPTETTICATMHECTAGGGRPPIGRPLSNTRALVLDADENPVPAGVPGELCIGGTGVARGYLNRPELCARRFVPDPFCNNPGERLYKTGDLVRWLPDGSLDFLGRIDEQVKIRGHRIELGEIEAALREHPCVREALATVQEDGPLGRRIVACWVPRGEGVSAGELRAHLTARLPQAMIPAGFVRLDALPLSPSGKVDRKAVRLPEDPLPAIKRHAPRTDRERLLCRVFGEVLGVEEVGIDESFFALGGDSILAIQLVAKAQKAGLGLSVQHVFQHQTVSMLADQALLAGTPVAEVGPLAGECRLTPIQRWFVQQDRPDPHHFNQALLLEAKQPLNQALVAETVRHLLTHHDALRFRYFCNRDENQGNGEWKATCAPPSDDLPLDVVDLSATLAGAVPGAIEIAAAAAQASLRLEQGPIARFVLFDLGPDRPPRLLIVIHHLAVDGISLRILLEDFDSVYEQLRTGPPALLPRKTASFLRWTERLVLFAQSEQILAELSFWRNRCVSESIPTDRAWGPNTVGASRTIVAELGVSDTRALLMDVPDAYRTQINDVLLTALLLTLAPWGKARRIRIDVEGHGREDIGGGVDVARTVGWLSTIYPVVLELADGPLGEVLKSVKEQLRRIPRHGIGYGLLRYLHNDPAVRGALAALPDAHVLFNYHGQLYQPLAASKLLRLARESAGALHSPLGLRTHALDIHGWIEDGALKLVWTYSENLHDRATIEKLAGRFADVLQEIVLHCRSPQAGGRTPSDYPLARLTQQSIDRLVGNGRGVVDVYPLSPMQQGMLFHTLHDPAAGEYIEQLAFRVEKDIDGEALRCALCKIVERHAILRTAFAWEGVPEPLQIVHANAEISLTEVDLRTAPELAQSEDIEALLLSERARGFDLRTAPAARVVLVRRGARASEILWTYHHILLDGWSFAIVLRELLQFYEAALCGTDLHLARPRPFRDYITWCAGQDKTAAEAFWRAALGDGPRATRIRVEERWPPARQATATPHRSQSVKLPGTTSRALEAFAHAHAVTLSTVVQGAFALLLAEMSGEQDVLFGTTVAGRSAGLEGIEAMVGLLINTVVVRARTTPDASLVDWLKDVQDAQVARLPYEHAALADVPLCDMACWI